VRDEYFQDDRTVCAAVPLDGKNYKKIVGRKMNARQEDKLATGGRLMV